MSVWARSFGVEHSMTAQSKALERDGLGLKHHLCHLLAV